MISFGTFLVEYQNRYNIRQPKPVGAPVQDRHVGKEVSDRNKVPVGDGALSRHRKNSQAKRNRKVLTQTDDGIDNKRNNANELRNQT